jgi:hypothetical protein
MTGGFAMRNCSNVGSLESFKLMDDIGVLPQDYVESALGLAKAPEYSVLITGVFACFFRYISMLM